MRARIVLSFLLAAVVLTPACGGTGGGASGDRSIVAAFYPLAFAAGRIAPGADVSNLTPAGAEPHDLELTAREVERVRTADLVLYVGGGFMPALEDAVSGATNAADLLDGLELLERNDRSGYGGERAADTSDPHVWLDPARYAAMAERIALNLGDPDGASDLVAELAELDDELRRGLERCRRRTIVTSHAAFGYLADAYGLEQIALTGISPEVEPSARAIEELIAKVDEEGATTVFFEALVSPRLAETVARAAGAETAVLNPLEGLTAGELEAGADYFSVMRENLDALQTALGCS